MRRCEVLIVGGGPAGSSCAAELVRAGLDVLVVDKQSFPRDKICAGWITPQIVRTLQLDLDDYRSQRICQPIRGFRTGMIGHAAVETRYDHPVSYGIRRCEFDDYLLRRSAAPTRLGETISQFEPRGDRWRVGDDLEARLLVGAGGHFCPVRRYLTKHVIGQDSAGADHDREGQPSVVMAQEAEFRLSDEPLVSRIAPEIPELYFCPDLQGYGWCFRKGDYLNIGLGRVGEKRLSSHMKEFLQWLSDSGRLTGEISTRFRGHAYRLFEGPPPPLVDDRALLVGDAAGLAYPQSGEGIRPAIESGILAAETILRAGGRYDRGTLACYEDELTKRLGIPRPRPVEGWLPASWIAAAAARLLASKTFSRRVVMDRWFLRIHQPALEPLAASVAHR